MDYVAAGVTNDEDSVKEGGVYDDEFSVMSNTCSISTRNDVF
jgi:hypothetical protein